MSSNDVGLVKKIDLSIVIISWNTQQLLHDCLTSIYKAVHEIDCEIFVVDNASSDGSVAMLKNDFEDVIIIENSENMGFARANNVAFPMVVGRYILMLNSDTIALENSFESAVKFLDNHADVGVLIPKIFNADGSIQHPCYIKEPSLYAEFYDAFELSKFVNRHDILPAGNMETEVAHGCGCSLFLRKEALDMVGVLDERMVFSFEDADICIRIRREGWRMMYCPASKIIHLGGASRKKHGNKAVHALLHSRYVFYKKYHGFFYLITLAGVFFISAVLKTLISSALFVMQPANRDLRKVQMHYNASIIWWHIKHMTLTHKIKNNGNMGK